MRRCLATTALLLLACAVGCTGDTSAPPASGTNASAPACSRPPDTTGTPAEQVAAAAAKLAGQSFTFTAELGDVMTVAGAADAPSGRTTGTMRTAGGGAVTTLVVVRDDYYIKYDNLPRADAGRWQHLKLPRGTVMKGAVNLGDPRDPLGSAALLDGLVTAERTGDCQYEGTMDVEQGDGETVVKFAAAVDAEGRLTGLAYILPAVSPLPALPMRVVYSEFGAVPDISVPPASEVTEASEEVRKVFRLPAA